MKEKKKTFLSPSSSSQLARGSAISTALSSCVMEIPSPPPAARPIDQGPRRPVPSGLYGVCRRH
ncbi:hypothetical protein LY78DRAFT_664560 [Colletotrichum sublineola]|nr:hypothetical protein LY78DRAFT_664560 [Colletotrichum sublineola]